MDPRHQPLPETPDDEALDDELAEMVADRIVELAARPGAHRVAALQMAGLLPEAGKISQEILCHPLGISRSRLQRLEARALVRLRKILDQ